MAAALVWGTPDAETLLMRIARVSSEHPESDDPRLIGYMVREGHWSPFEMVSFCFEINTTRDIGRQILRHRSFSFQEFSQRYQRSADTSLLNTPRPREARLQDKRKRQRSLENGNPLVAEEWKAIQAATLHAATVGYNRALELGIAKEVARAVLPEGLTATKMYMSGTLRSWIHYVGLRCGDDTQKEHREIAAQIRTILTAILPSTAKAVGWPVLEAGPMHSIGQREALVEPHCIIRNNALSMPSPTRGVVVPPPPGEEPCPAIQHHPTAGMWVGH